MTGRVKGAAFLEDLPYIKIKKGQDGLDQLQQGLKERKVTLDLNSIHDQSYYPIDYRVQFLKVLKEDFGWSDKKIYTMAKHAPKAPTGQKFVIRYFVSVENAFKMAGHYWDRYFDFGKLIPREYDMSKRKMYLDLYEFDQDPLMYTQLSGYFTGVAILTGVKDPKTTVVDKTFKDASRSFLIEWEG